MPRSRSSPAPRASAAAARPRPAASSSSSSSTPPKSTSWFGGGAKPSAPPPAQHAPAASPMQHQGGGGGGMFSGLMGGVMQGAALGTGSAFAHRAVDGLMGGRETRVVHEQAEGGAPAPAPPMQQTQGVENPCKDRIALFSDCMSQYNGDMGACQPYFDAMQQCKRAYA